MSKNRFLLILFPLAIIAGHGCKKDVPMYGSAPEIKFISVVPSVVTQFKDSIVFTISYQDGDGDLGQNDPNVNNLFIIDNRINIMYSYRIPQLAPDGAKIIIKGNLTVVLKNTSITDNSFSQLAVYSIYLKDRAGNRSNTVLTSAITVKE